ncbi:unnamed protein product [Strongylus vulgaris]|uniref:Non-specific serine/threonine protein kinase n=1 Tax=Strongylus vulgaris TaxID=40348 RepID=A0A3P7HWZ5_STRVU|nr:unnamed protein product [Strongylus vulgaris]
MLDGCHNIFILQKCAPQAHSTPFDQISGNPFETATGGGKEVSRCVVFNSDYPLSLADVPISPVIREDSFEKVDSCVLPEYPGLSTGDVPVLKDTSNGEEYLTFLVYVLLYLNLVSGADNDDTDNDANTLAALLETSMDLSLCGHVNGEYLMDAAGVLPEVIGFLYYLRQFAPGLYPDPFLAAWDEYDEEKESENDRPTEYASKDQLFVTMGMAMGGADLEHFQDQVLSALLQIAISLVVAEERLEFEHRDLHIGNVLVLEEDNDLDLILLACFLEGTTLFRDLESDEELFAGTGDYQFDIYRMMRHENQ